MLGHDDAVAAWCEAGMRRHADLAELPWLAASAALLAGDLVAAARRAR